MAVLLYVQLAHIKAELLACYAVLHAKHVEILIQTVLHVYHPFSILIMDAEILALLVLIIIMEHVQHANLVVWLVLQEQLAILVHHHYTLSYLNVCYNVQQEVMATLLPVSVLYVLHHVLNAMELVLIAPSAFLHSFNIKMDVSIHVLLPILPILDLV